MTPRRYKIFAMIAAITLAADQASKYWARHALAKFGWKGDSWVNGWWDMRLSFNTGSAFGMFNKLGGAGRIMLSIVGILACVVIVAILRRAKDAQGWLAGALALVGGGAIGNVIDRVYAGKVTDFVVWKYKTHEWPAFNVADAALVAGVVILFLDIGREPKPKAQSKDEQQLSGASRK